ncbi:hypothetical protein, partial [Novosphingobium indicum]|uniref:hypothetical protein n=1 Tax=Novosphingobium indicum TaxID=462949 RepID=UPI001E3CEC4B
MFSYISTMSNNGSPPLLTKTIQRINGEWVKSAYDNAYLFACSWRPAKTGLGKAWEPDDGDADAAGRCG